MAEHAKSSGGGDGGGIHWWAIVPILIVFLLAAFIWWSGFGATSGTSQANVEYWFRLVYDCFHGGCAHSPDYTQFMAFLAKLWLWVGAIGYALSVIAAGVIVYCLVRIHELREEEEHELTTLIPSAEMAGQNTRWQHIESLMASGNKSDFRQAIIEADIMLDDLLSKEGYMGEGPAEKLKAVPRGKLASLSNAWGAHQIRNRIAHDGSAFDISDTLARRTIAQYESVFRELGAI